MLSNQTDCYARNHSKISKVFVLSERDRWITFSGYWSPLQWQFEVRINLKPWILSANCTNCYLNKSYLTSQKPKFFRLNGTKAKKRKANVINAKIINPVSDVQRSRSALLMITHFSIPCHGYGLYSLNILYVAFSLFSHTLLTVDVFFVSFYALVLQDKFVLSCCLLVGSTSGDIHLCTHANICIIFFRERINWIKVAKFRLTCYASWILSKVIACKTKTKVLRLIVSARNHEFNRTVQGVKHSGAEFLEHCCRLNHDKYASWITRII